MLLKFRFHRGGFDEAMKEVYSFESMGDFFGFLRQRFDVKRQDFRFEPYGFDDRLDSYSYIVTRRNPITSTYIPIGFCWEFKK